ncbi:hypothetical protein THAOC_04464 [Thalassiosira oceanica]|uniref:Secreted protein n=1 Tax=Thalassiosira oceanica TaxID=159749 RepID=K0T540_THAOC|nr:hypothetical protein THAOC_04464 [Thalassiosira oceanica]|eukprot:EJK73888.1 hypothetical protein THAOC_04464 [Thalassiosira oceanica]
MRVHLLLHTFFLHQRFLWHLAVPVGQNLPIQIDPFVGHTWLGNGNCTKFRFASSEAHCVPLFVERGLVPLPLHAVRYESPYHVQAHVLLRQAICRRGRHRPSVMLFNDSTIISKQRGAHVLCVDALPRDQRQVRHVSKERRRRWHEEERPR